MFVALSFIGKLPSYIIESVYQIRLYFNGSIYLITDDINSCYLAKLENVIIINYNEVRSQEFINTIKSNYNKFYICHKLKGREQLFIRSFERFFLVSNLMKRDNLSDCLFLELDNLIYRNPNDWLEEFSKYELCYLFDNYDRCSAGLMYIKSPTSLDGFLNYSISYIESSNEFLTEMICLYRYYILNSHNIMILPTYWKDNNIPEIASMNFDKSSAVSNCLDKVGLFDALGIGIYLLGMDMIHTNNRVIKGCKNKWGAIDYTKNKFKWEKDIDGLNKPYIMYLDRWILINNLHVHSKNLKEGLSKGLNLT
jgi:hypothetical protein